MCALLLSLLIVLIGKGNRKGKGEAPLSPRSPGDPSEALFEFLFFIMAPMDILFKLIFGQQLMQSIV